MNWKSATDKQLHTMLAALGDYSKRQEKSAQAIGNMELPEELADTPQLMRDDARETDAMREEVAREMHIRGITACSLAHPNHATCPWGVNVSDADGR
jgi:hypothetical protein